MLIPLVLWAQTPRILDPRIQNEPNDDVREIKTRDEMQRQAELDDSLAMPGAADRRARRGVEIQTFVREVTRFKSVVSDLLTFRPDGKYAPATARLVRQKSHDLERSANRMLGFISSHKRSEAAIAASDGTMTLEDKTGLLCWLATRLDPKLNQLVILERQNLSDPSLREDVAGQLRQIARVGKDIAVVSNNR
jgi:hypothetical protein